MTTTLHSTEYQSLLSQCVHCGLCLPACPTYRIFHTEMDGPRGRIQLMTAAAEGRIDLGGAFQEHLDLCLGCRACETACPSGVQYGLLLEGARQAMAEEQPQSRRERLVRWFALRQLLPHQGRLRLLARLLWVVQKLKLDTLAKGLGVIPPSMQGMVELLPPLKLNQVATDRAAPALGKKRGDVALLYGCVQDAFLSGVNAATVRVLQRNGYEVHFPKGQNCCGAAGLHMGEVDEAKRLARQNIDACADRDYVAVISNAGGCGATLKEYGHLLADDPAYAEKAQTFVAKLQDISEFLADHLHMPPTKPVARHVTYVESCHLRHGQRVIRQPRQLLNAIPGLTFTELQQPDRCCGSAGVYNITQPETANQVLDAKLADVQQTGADLVVTSNTGCHMQMIYGMRKAGSDAEVLHLVELLDRAYGE
ncbi:MAG TPA: heterodisulfide reductase-related iron-sulfur binding cluster [Caldilineaceae bacterium]|nr:heterodisulfide reductase-related iron-sulfur binding cluster [Caldilineaceae bacterium]